MPLRFRCTPHSYAFRTNPQWGSIEKPFTRRLDQSKRAADTAVYPLASSIHGQNFTTCTSTRFPVGHTCQLKFGPEGENVENWMFVSLFQHRSVGFQLFVQHDLERLSVPVCISGRLPDRSQVALHTFHREFSERCESETTPAGTIWYSY